MAQLEVEASAMGAQRAAAPQSVAVPPTVLIVIALVVAVLLTVAIVHPIVPGNPASRFATIEALVENGTWSIDGTLFEPHTIDKVMIDGHLYSSKPPLMPLAGAAVYAVSRALTGWEFVTHPLFTVTVIRFFLQILPFAFFLYYLWRFLCRWMTSEQARWWVFLSVAFGSYLFGYSTKLNNHAPAAFCVFGALYCGLGVVRWSWAWRWGLAAGIWSGLAIALDLGTIPFVGALGVYLLAARQGRATLAYGLGALALIGLGAWLSLVSSGSVVPVYLRRELYNYPGSYWSHPRAYDALNEPKTLYLFHMTLGHHGWFAMSPTLFLSFAGIVAMWRARLRAETVLVASVCLGVFVYYWLETANYGGACAGMRWLIITLPLWLLPVFQWADRGLDRWRGRLIFGVLMLAGVAQALPMIWDPWTKQPWHFFFQSFGWGST